MEGLQITFPVPRNDRTAAQEWWYQRGQRLYYLDCPWTITGQLWIFSNEGSPIHQDRAELRFGQHPYMRGFTLCLAVQYESDDKFEFCNARGNSHSGGFIGQLSYGPTAFFRPNPLQVVRLEALRNIFPNLEGIDAVLGDYIMRAQHLIE